MDTTAAERHIQALLSAKACAELGARVRTITLITGLPHREVVRLFFDDQRAARRGRPPESANWFDRSNLLDRVEASIVVALFARIRELGFGPTEALIGAYKQYCEKCGPTPRISFDRAFDLVCNTYGVWLSHKPQLKLADCQTCDFRFLCPAGETSCHFCKLIKRYASDRRVQAKFPPRSLPNVRGF